MMYTKISTLILLLFLYSCSNKNNKEKNKSNSKIENRDIKRLPKNRVFPKGTYNSEYPLVRFYYDIDTTYLHKSKSLVSDEISNIIVDTTNLRLIISFDYEGELSCILNGQLDREPEFKRKSDTIYLDYFENCEEIKKPKKVFKKLDYIMSLLID